MEQLLSVAWVPIDSGLPIVPSNLPNLVSGHITLMHGANFRNVADLRRSDSAQLLEFAVVQNRYPITANVLDVGQQMAAHQHRLAFR